MTANEAAIRKTYQAAEKRDIPEFVNCFTPDGTFTDESINVTYRGPKEIGRTVEIYATAFPDMHRELFAFYVIGDTVVVERALQGTHKGPLELPIGIIQPTGKKMNAPCCDVFQLTNGKIKSFNCYPSGHGGPDAAGSVGKTQGCAVKVLSTSVPIFTRDIEAALERYEALTRETV